MIQTPRDAEYFTESGKSVILGVLQEMRYMSTRSELLQRACEEVSDVLTGV